MALAESTTTIEKTTRLARLPFTKADIEQTVPARFEQVVRRFPASLALTGHGRQWTYRELDGRVNGIARVIREQAGSGPGRVAYLVEHSPEMVIATLAVLKAGKTYVAIHPALPAARRLEIVGDMAPDLILTTAAFAVRAREAANGSCPVLLLDEIGDVAVAIGPQREVQPQHPSTIFYTSGTTGRPKGVVKSHRAVLHRVWLSVQHDGVGPGDRQSLLTHCSFSASEADMFGALLNGATLCVFDFASEGLTAFREWLEAEAITLLHPPVLLFRRFLSSLTEAHQFPSVRLVALAGDVVLPADVAAWRRHFARSCVLMHRFSITETGLLCVARIDIRSVPDADRLLAGHPVEDKVLELVDDAGAPVAAGETGELVVKSRYIAEGYWRQVEGNATGFETDLEDSSRRIYRTGDRGRFLADGRFLFLGRRDRLVKIRGFRVELAEVEAALRRHSGLRENVVVVQDREAHEKQMLAYVVASSEPAPTGPELRTFLQGILPHYMIPSGFVFLDALPVTPTGKIDRQALPSPSVAAGSFSAVTAPGNDTEQQLLRIWTDVLGRERIGTRDNFFDLGGHSLLAAQMFARVEERLRIRLPLSTLFRAPTIEALATAIGEGKRADPWRSLVAIQTSGARRPLFAIPGVGGNVLGYHDLSRLLGPEQPFYGLQSRGLSGTEAPLSSIEAIATTYLTEIRQVQPDGPYNLMGVCMGAVVAYEMAQQLAAAGERVDLLALLEPRPPAAMLRREFKPGPKALAAMRLVGSRIRLTARTFRRLKGRERFEYLGERFKRIRQAIVERDLFTGNRGELHSGIVRQSNLAAVHRYVPRPYQGPLILFLAEGRKLQSEADARLGWRQLAAGGIEIHRVQGNDSGLTLMRPNVETLAPLVAASLERGSDQRQAPIETVADAFLEQLNARGVEYVFINPGSDTAPIQESFAKFTALGRATPKLILCLHESVALAAAHGYFMVSGRPQVVLVHADVGTQNLGANLHNAQRGRAGVVICAGSAPASVAARTRHMDWIQDQFNQAGSVEAYVKWHHRLSEPGELPATMERAFEQAGAEPAGPVYLTLPRDVLLMPQRPGRAGHRAAPAPVATASEDLTRAAEWLLDAERPLILTAYTGRNPSAPGSLARLAEVLGAPVVESRHRINIPASHPLHLGFCAVPYVQKADCILIVDHDVPWIPSQGRPSSECRIIHIDMDTLKRDMPTWGFPVDLAIQGDSALLLPALAEAIGQKIGPDDLTRIEHRRREVTAEHAAQRNGWRARALELAARTPIAPEWAAHCLNDIVNEETLIVSEAVSNNPVLWHHLSLDAPGTYYQSLGSGLGWGLGAALGAKLASPGKTVICLVGDGSWLFGSPIVAYWTAQQQQSPFLTVIFNNQAYAATADAIRSVAPNGYAQAADSYPASELPKPPLYSNLAEAMGLWARTVTDPEQVRATLREALDEVRHGRSALVDICVASSRQYEQSSDE